MTQSAPDRIKLKLIGYGAMVAWCLLAVVTPLRAQTAAPGGITIDASTSTDVSVPSHTVSTVPFSTVSANELLLAFVSADYLNGPNTTVFQITGGGLTWVPVVKTNVQSGSSEIWRAFAAAPLSNVTVTATLSHRVVSSMTVMSFAGVDTTGANGSGAIGAIGSGNAFPGAPTASLVTTRANSWVFGVGNDYDNGLNRVPGSNQILIHQDLSPTNDTYWVQSQGAPTLLSGSTVTINDTSPTTDRYNLSICEILPALTPQGSTISGTLSPALAGSGATVTLTNGTSTATTTADASGNYSFTGLANGNYTVAPSNSGYAFTPAYLPVAIASAAVTAVNFTGQPGVAWSISGTISPASAGIGATITLSGDASATTTADAFGNYSFSGLVAGNYTVTPTNNAYTFTPANQTVTISSADSPGVIFAGQSLSISGTLSPSSAGAGAIVTLSGDATATTTADASGNYSFTGLINGNYSVTPSNSGYTFTPANQAVTISGANAPGINFTAQTVVTSWNISGTISPSSAGSGATVTLSGDANATTTADASGNYSFAGLASGNYTVTPSTSGYTFTPANQAVTISGANAPGINFAAQSVVTFWNISGTIGPSSGGAGATVTLTGAVGATTTADASGNYTFAGLPDGNYIVTPSNNGYTFTPSNLAVTVADANLQGVNFTVQAVVTSWSISGTISPSSGGGGATVILSGAASATTTADASGNYSFAGLSNGNYTVTPSNNGYTFTPANQAVTMAGANVPGTNFTAQAATWSISGTITPSAGGGGATVMLTGASSATTTADASGNYTFAGLANGNYTVAPLNDGYTFTPATQPVTISGANSAGVNFTAQSATAAGAGSVGAWSVSGTISPASAGVAITMASGTAVLTTVTDGSGNYSFTGLGNGIYSIGPTSSSYSFSPGGQTVTVNNASVTGVNFSTSPQTAPVLTISGAITSSTGGGGATVTLGGAANATLTATASGAYSFSGIANGSYTITPTNAGYSFSPPVQSVVINGGSAGGVNFTAAAGYMISGTLSPAEYSVGATVTLSGPVNATTTVTGSSTFTFTGLPAGTYTITPSSTNATFSPTSQEISVSDANAIVSSFSAASSENVIFFDNFSTPTLNSAWTVISRHGEYAQNETECNIPQMVASGSGMTISSAAENWTCGDFNNDGSTRHSPSSWPYITGDVQWTSQSFSTGTVEVRAKFPSYATSLWPAIWLLGSNCQTTNIFTADTGYSNCSSLGANGYIEADLVECYGGQSGFCQFHVANPSFGIGNGCDANYTVDTNWHTFTTVWTAASFKQYMDGALVTTCNQSITGQMFLIIQTQTGGSGGNPNNSDLPAQLKIDYVKVTQP